MQVVSTPYIPMLCDHGNIADPEWPNALSESSPGNDWPVLYRFKLD